MFALQQKRRRKLLFCLSSILLIFTFFLPAYPVKAQPERIIRVGYYENAPKIFTAEDGTVSGFWADLIRYIAVQERWQIEWVHGTWDEGLSRLANNEIDIMPDMGWSLERSQLYTLSNETVLVSWSRVYVPENSEIETILDLDGKTIAGLTGSVNFDGPEGIKELISKFDIDVNFIGLDSYDEVFQALEDKEVDAGVTNKDFGNLNESEYLVSRTPIIFKPSRIVFAFNNDSVLTPYLVESIDRQMGALKESNFSTYYHLLEKWLGVRQSPRNFLPLWVRWGFGITAILLAVFFVFSILLKQQVEEKTYTLQRHTEELETLNAVITALSSSLELNEVLELIIDQIGRVIPMDSGAIFLHGKEGVKVMVDRGISPSVKGHVFSANSQLFSEIEKIRKPLVLKDAKDDKRFENWGQSPHIENWMGVPLIVRDTLIGFLTLDSIKPNVYSTRYVNLALSFASQAAQAIENARQFHRAQRRSKQLAALREVDKSIASSLDLKVTLDVFLEQVLTQLNVDAARVLLYEDKTKTLTLEYEKGFQIAEDEHTSLKSGQGLAGKVAIHQEPLFIPDLYQAEIDFSASPEFKKEGFVAYHAIPLIIKETALVGILEVFSLSHFHPTEEWINFLHTLAGQAAIAIDKIRLFNDLERSNANLQEAYDATIEGWAQALELRDMETEGHSRRVVEITVKLASELGFSEDDLVHIRRGALLHDIGKMGIPDAILQKPGKLTEEEWEVMRLHPVYAYEWLVGIEYLYPALDIPYSHHEKWDGTGYPRGLKGEHIPKAARIFSVVDAWDALRSDRPYRKAWSSQETLEYIQQESGKAFDPEIVEFFINFLDQEESGEWLS